MHHFLGRWKKFQGKPREGGMKIYFFLEAQRGCRKKALMIPQQKPLSFITNQLSKEIMISPPPSPVLFSHHLHQEIL